MEKPLPQKPPPPRFCLTSGKGGVGKTSLAVNLACALALKGSCTLLVDGDLGLANVDVLLRLPVKTTVRDVLEGEGNPLDAVVFPSPLLGILPASSGVPEMANLGPEDQGHLGQVLEEISRHFEIVLVDTAAGLASSVLWFNTWVDHNLLVVTPDPTSMTDAYALIKVLSLHHQVSRFHLLLNLVKGEAEGRQTFQTLERVAAKFLKLKLQFVRGVPQDPEVRRAVREQVPFVQQAPEAPASRAVLEIAEQLRNWNHPGGTAGGRPSRLQMV